MNCVNNKVFLKKGYIISLLRLKMHTYANNFLLNKLILLGFKNSVLKCIRMHFGDAVK